MIDYFKVHYDIICSWRQYHWCAQDRAKTIEIFFAELLGKQFYLQYRTILHEMIRPNVQIEHPAELRRLAGAISELRRAMPNMENLQLFFSSHFFQGIYFGMGVK